jgi:hypothetical protein
VWRRCLGVGGIGVDDIGVDDIGHHRRRSDSGGIPFVGSLEAALHCRPNRKHRPFKAAAVFELVLKTNHFTSITTTTITTTIANTATATTITPAANISATSGDQSVITGLVDDILDWELNPF